MNDRLARLRTRPRAIRIFGGIVVAGAIAAAVLFIRSQHSASNAGAPARTAPAVATSRARFGPFVVRVNAAGRIGAPAGSQAKLSFAGSGLIEAISVGVGERVVAGQTLAKLDTSALEIDAATARADAAAAAASYGGGAVPSAALASARARLAAAAAKLHAADDRSGSANSDAAAAATALRQSEEKIAADRRALDRAQQIFAAGVGARKDVEAARSQLALDRADDSANQSKVRSATSAIGGAKSQARADYEQAANDVRAAQAQIGVTGAQALAARQRYAQAERALASGTLLAPQGGVVLQLLKHVGEAVDPTQPVVVVGPQSDRSVTLNVAGVDAALVRVGDRVAVTDATHRSTGNGRVVAVVPAVDPSTQTTTIVTSAVPPQGAPGDAVSASIEIATHRGIVVPASALIDDPQTGKTLVFVRIRGTGGDVKFEPREVRVTASDERSALLGSGLRAGETVAAQGAFDLLAPAGGG